MAVAELSVLSLHDALPILYLAVWVGSSRQVGLSGSNRVKLTVPVGVNPPETVAESWIPIPTVPPADWVVAIEGLSSVVVTCCACHSEDTGLLWEVPWWVAIHR